MRTFLKSKTNTARPKRHIGQILAKKIHYWWLKLNRSRKYQPKFSYQHIFFSYLGGFIGIATLAYLSSYTKYPLIAAPFGATAVLVFGVPESPLAQPRNVVGGNCIGAIVSIILVHLWGIHPWVEALAVATTIKLMQLTKTVHPPGGAVALVGVMSAASWHFIFTPVFVGSIITVFCTYCFNNVVSKRPYPRHWL